MSEEEAKTPRVFLARHGETEWAKSGRFTGVSEIPLNAFGEEQVAGTAKILVGPNKLLDPAKLGCVFISPRIRAQSTFELLFDETEKDRLRTEGKVKTTEKLAEWGYGIYEGLKDTEIRALRKERGLDKEKSWDIWRDGCEEGETAQEVTARLDSLIDEIYAIQSPNMRSESPSDVVLVAHGHLLRAFAKRWLRYPMNFPLSMMLPPGSVGILSYHEHDINQPAFFLGMGFLPSKAE
ncbi:probable phosphoglycerate mutase [Phialocephala subalpina]|uniref:Probable phosphoglycerate mutase n=1 Tax=Phialocephala subalpina TaxID=576137 RepID=A0A1L7XIQ9_9HELO|nr:probable phosphoglycerate mutase [Phialocephala subalpina]